MDPEEDKDEEMEFQDAKRSLKAIYGHSDSESSADERRKMLHVMFRAHVQDSVPRGGGGCTFP
jgi:hypothetical protein